MRALLSTIGSRGDVQPLVALAFELRRLGHDARLCVPPDFCRWIEDLGFPVIPIGPELRRAAAVVRPASGAPSPQQLRRLAEESVATQFETVGAAAEGCDVLVAATALQIAARSVAEKRRMRYVFAAYSPSVLPSPHHPPPPLPVRAGAPPPATADNRELWALDADRFKATFLAALSARRTALGLAAVSDVRSHMFGNEPWLAADAALGPWPEGSDLRVFQTGAWLLPDERVLAPEVENFLEAGDAPVYFGYGSMRPPDGTGDVRTRLDAARAVGRRAIVSAGWADLSGLSNESDCLVVRDVNLRALFTRVSVAGHHGGAGTTTLAALAGTPQVVIPQAYDQHYWAGRVRELGIGDTVPAASLTVDSLASALRSALHADVRGRARSIAARVRTDGARVAAQRLVAG